MELIERAGFLTTLQSTFQHVVEGEGHCVFVNGEAGIGKTSLVNTFCREVKANCNVYRGTCDALFTPRPLAPVYDILLQMGKDLPEGGADITDRPAFFTEFLHELINQEEPTVIVFEDIHWADEATLDFIKFLARRIAQLPCLFILTYRDNEIYVHHPLRNVLGQLNPGSFTRMQLLPLSKQAVEKLAEQKGYNGENVYSISGGNPFYVTEILASYSPGIPDNIKDSILAVYHRAQEATRHIWDILSVLPAGVRLAYLEKMEPQSMVAIQHCLDSKILVVNEGVVCFKHELYRRTIEESLSPFLRIALNKQILHLFRENFEQHHQIEQIIHHAKNANEYEHVVHYAPLAARQAVAVGAHIEAARLYLTAIEYYQDNDTDTLIGFYEAYAYECYLTNQLKEAIIYTGKALQLWKKKNDPEKIGNCMRFLSRLWWFDGNRKQAESFAAQAVAILEKQPSSKAKAMAYSNMSQLKMLSDEVTECIAWGEKAIAMAEELDDTETLSHALNNVGDVQARIRSSREKGIALLRQSLDIALKNGYHEHVARAYTNLGHNGLLTKDYDLAKESLDAGIQYCEERDLGSWTNYMVSSKARLNMETGNWNEALQTANFILASNEQSPVVKIGALAVAAAIKMRRGDADVLPLLTEAKEKALETMELQRIIPALVASLEYEWITGKTIIEKKVLDTTVGMVEQMGNLYENSEFAFWLWKARKQPVQLREFYEGYQVDNPGVALRAAALWERSGCPYERALTLFEGSEDDKRKAITVIQGLGANAVYEKLKLDMRESGIKNIPRGIRKTTQSNPALLTERELDVLQCLNEGLQNKEIAAKLFISAKTVDHHISSILYKLEVKSRIKAVQEAIRLEIIK